MNTIKEQIKSQKLSQVYLLSGEERYLIDFYGNRLSDIALEGQDAMMNKDIFNQDSKDMDKILDSLETLPFFASRRVIVLSYMDLFAKKNKKKQEVLLEGLKNLPSSTLVIIQEAAIDKRSKLYKFVQKQGTTESFDYLDDKDLVKYIARGLKRYQLKITAKDARYLIERVGYDLNTINQEIEKVAMYSYGEEVVGQEAISEVCVQQLEAKIFDLVDAVGMKDRQKTMNLYQEMIALREQPTRILYMISRQYTLIFKAKLLNEARRPLGDMSGQLKVPPFVLKKLLSQSRQFSLGQLKNSLKGLVDVEYSFKSGQVDLTTGLELALIEMTRHTND